MAELITRLSSKKGQKLQYTVGRCLLTATFLDDAIRVTTDWSDQVRYLKLQIGFAAFLAPVLCLTFVVFQSAGSVGLFLKKSFAAVPLLVVLSLQMLLYARLFDVHFILRNLAVVGGLLVILSEDSKKNMMASIMDTSKSNVKVDVSRLLGRALLATLLVTLLFKERSNLNFIVFIALEIVASALGLMVLVGYQAKLAALALSVLLIICDLFAHNWLLVGDHTRDLHRYYFFQLISTAGGLLLIGAMGAGRFAVDHKKMF